MKRERLLLLLFSALLLALFAGTGCRSGEARELPPPETAEQTGAALTETVGEEEEKKAETEVAESDKEKEPEEDSAPALPAHEGAWTPSELEHTLGGDDPIEGFNRAMFSCTDFIMNYFVDPVGRVYTSILPRPVIEKFNNLCVNLEFPTRAFSCLFRAEWRGAGDETVRFFVNTTLGIAGLFDPAADWFDFYSTESDFGQTFAAWGIGPGCTLILPLMSTLNVRDTVASIFDMAFDIKTYIPYAGYATALNRMVIAHRSYSKAVEGSSDPYKSYRELALLRRELQMRMFFYHAQNQAAAARKAKEQAEEAVKEAEESGEAEKLEEAKKALAALLPPPPDRRTTPKPEGVTGDWISIPGYDGQSPLLDTLRVAMFQAQNNDDPWFFRLSFFNSDFTKQCSDRKVYFAEDLPALRYGFWKAPEKEEEEKEKGDEAAPPAPEPQKLAILLPGIGGNYFGMTTTALAELLHNRGFAVAALDSTFTWQFMRSTGKYRLPGYLPEDAALLRRAIRLVLDELTAAEKIRDPEVVLLGYSFGALHTLKIAELEAKENTLGIRRYLAINPPVDLDYAMTQADTLARTGSEWSDSEAVDRLSDTGGRAMGAMMKSYPVYDPEAEPVPGVSYRAPIDETAAAYLAGLYFRISIRGLLFTAHREWGLTLDNPYAWGDRNRLYREIDKVSFREYAERFLAMEHPDKTLEELFRNSGLRSFEAELKRNPAIRVIHNYDDFLLSPEDRLWLDRTLGKRITWFDRGAHLGNLYVLTVQNRIVELLQEEKTNDSTLSTPPADPGTAQ